MVGLLIIYELIYRVSKTRIYVLNEMAITMKGSISDLTFVKSKFVSSMNNSFRKF